MIELIDICKDYGKAVSQVHALSHINLHVENGGYLAIMGPSGSGKSTLMNLLGCLDRQTAGRYLLNGIDVAALNADETAALRNQHIGFVFQSFFLLPRLTALENVELPMIYAGAPKNARRDRAMHLLHTVGLSKRASHMPSQMSGGQCQRVAIARALANSPKLLLADEPTGNLDSRTSAEIMELMRDLNREGLTVVLITHEEEVAAQAKTRACLRDGKLIQGEGL